MNDDILGSRYNLDRSSEHCVDVAKNRYLLHFSNEGSLTLDADIRIEFNGSDFVLSAPWLNDGKPAIHGGLSSQIHLGDHDVLLNMGVLLHHARRSGKREYSLEELREVAIFTPALMRETNHKEKP